MFKSMIGSKRRGKKENKLKKKKEGKDWDSPAKRDRMFRVCTTEETVVPSLQQQTELN